MTLFTMQAGLLMPVRDIEMVNSELIMHDLIFIEKRVERIESSRKRKADARLDAEEELLGRMKVHLEQDLCLRTFKLTEEEEKLISGYPFITGKEMLIVLNVGDSEIRDTALMKKLADSLSKLHIEVMQVSAKLEAEISMLESEEEKKEFMEDAGIAEAGS